MLLIAALATRAELLLLDEPTSGLDPLMEVAFRDCIAEAQQRGQTVRLGVDPDAAGLSRLHVHLLLLVVCLFVVSQVGVARAEEGSGRLETTLALPVGRRRWLGGRLALALWGAVSISLAAGALAWAGAASAGVNVSLARLLEAGANCLPVAILFLGLAALCYAIAPRAGTGIAYGLVCLAFLWQLFGAVLGAPGWLVDLSPFEHVGLVPAQPFRAGAAAVMLGVGLVGALAAIGVFQRRDLVGG